MYQIFKDGGVFALVETPIYIRLHENGCFVQATPEQAQGIAIQGTPYQLLGRESMERDLEVVGISEVDGGSVVITQQNNINEMIRTMLEV